MTSLKYGISIMAIILCVASSPLSAVGLSGSKDKQVSVMPGGSFASGNGAVSYISVSQMKAVFDGAKAEGAYTFNGTSYHNFEINWPELTWMDSDGQHHVAQLENNLLGRSYYGKISGVDVYILFEVTMLGIVASPYALSLKDVGINPEQKIVLFWR